MVGPHRFIDLFSTSSIQWYKKVRKDNDGNKVTWNKENASLRNSMNVFNYFESEMAAYNAYIELLESYKNRK